MAHIVWDWNGTLFDDLDAVVDATNEIFVSYGLPMVDLAGFQAVYTRPIWACYERLLGRELEQGEWERLDAAFHDSYHRLMERCRLAADARHAIDALSDAGHTQSLLSMWHHDRLTVAVRRYGIGEIFRRVDGLRPEEAGGSKAEFMVRHLTRLGVDPSEVVAIGDSVDDAVAARHAGARAILYAGGMQGRAELDRFGVPVVERLTEVSAYI
ncbi:HAD family hydrolase [Actinoallomurus rhizosphaericola]|uniref:HAD family hydrolase n=1 Tax=Actinoallomurus rhizosphaericola TaxID=2952536 RepID=UPI0020921D17|nr:HAD family hydrolase [Actinoallomurus rhizosphaericola]MCO5998814.1 HAD family hydrolase [Actinoallomurus rhizosphaericola]